MFRDSRCFLRRFNFLVLPYTSKNVDLPCESMYINLTVGWPYIIIIGWLCVANTHISIYLLLFLTEAFSRGQNFCNATQTNRREVINCLWELLLSLKTFSARRFAGMSERRSRPRVLLLFSVGEF